ncbi:MAG: hypothetical protein ACRC0R_05090, partial [Cetobacterium sp.]
SPIVIKGGDDGYLEILDVAEVSEAVTYLSDTDTSDPFLVMIPGVTDINIQKVLVDLTVIRNGDVKVMLDAPNTVDSESIVEHFSTINSMYIEALAGWGVAYDKYRRREVHCPPTVAYGKAFLKAKRISEYGSTAGKNRGVLDTFNEVVNNYTPDQKIGMQNAKINPVIDKKGLIMVYNNLTMIRKNSVFADSNVTNVHIALKKAVLATSDDFLFEGNMVDTWEKWVNTVTPILDKIQKDYGIYSYQVLMGIEDGTVTATDIDTGRMPGIVKYKPTREAKEIDIYFNAYSYGVEFDK